MIWFNDLFDNNDYCDNESRIEKTDSGYKLEIDVPGFNKTNLTVSSPADNEILITGETKNRKLRKQISVPFNVSDTTAEVKDGVLVLEWKERKKFIEIK